MDGRIFDRKLWHLKVKLEAEREKEEVPVGARGLGRNTIRSFLETYQKKDTHTISQVPDPVSREVIVLPNSDVRYIKQAKFGGKSLA